MNDAHILSGIQDVARKHIEWEAPIEPDMRLVEDLFLDSIKLLTLAMEVENHFKICLDPERDHELITVADLVTAIRRQLLESPERTTQYPDDGNDQRGREGTE